MLRTVNRSQHFSEERFKADMLEQSRSRSYMSKIPARVPLKR